MIEFEYAYIRPIKALHAGRKNTVAHNTRYGVIGVVMLFVENAAAGSEFLFGLPVVAAELENESLW